MVQEAEMPHMYANQAHILTQSTLQVTGTPKALREYSLQGQTATGGLNGCWKIFAAKAKKEGKASSIASATHLQFILLLLLAEPREIAQVHEGICSKLWRTLLWHMLHIRRTNPAAIAMPR